jgi:hypothetical protein
MRSGGGNVEPLTKARRDLGGAQADVLMWWHLHGCAWLSRRCNLPDGVTAA